MSSNQEYTEADIEIGKLVDSLRELQAIKESFASNENSRTVEIHGKEVDAERLTESMLVFQMRRFRELVDMSIPVYADFISELEQLPGMDVSMKKYEQFKAAEMKAAG